MGLNRLTIDVGEEVLFKEKRSIIVRIIDLSTITIQELETNIVHTVKIKEVLPFQKDGSNLPNNYLTALTDKEWETAKKKYEIIKPILDDRKNFDLVKSIAEKSKVHYTTLYRWVKLFDETGTLSSLVGFKKNGGKGKSRISEELNGIVNNAIEKLYLDPSKKSINKVVREVEKVCKERKLKSPHPNTIRNRIKNISEEEFLKKRYGKGKARDKFEPIKKHFPGADYPLAVVQIDHTKVDIVLVDEHYRKSFLRPWLTLAMDVYSRMVVGFYLSFDPPGEMGTGLCLANSILPKDIWMEKNQIEGEWPCWGIMRTIHLDNAREFRGKMLRKACQNYGIDIEFRPVAQPHWGGHVERLLGTFSKEIHNLPGTTFSNTKDRENYDSEKNASLTINEFEKWLMIYIVQVYHKKIHSSINMSPLQKYMEGVFGVGKKEGVGLPPMLMNERRLKLDFMPYVERTIQEYGVVIDHIYYYDEVLRKYIHSKDSLSPNSSKRKYMFRRDPRDISIIYFYDPELNDYFEIPYRDTSKPPISIWEFNEVIRNLNKNRIIVDEDAIFNAYRNMEEIELNAIKDTKRLKRTSRYADKRNQLLKKQTKVNEVEIEKDSKLSIPDIKPFEDIDDEAFA